MLLTEKGTRKFKKILKIMIFIEKEGNKAMFGIALLKL